MLKNSTACSEVVMYTTKNINMNHGGFFESSFVMTPALISQQHRMSHPQDKRSFWEEVLIEHRLHLGTLALQLQAKEELKKILKRKEIDNEL